METKKLTTAENNREAISDFFSHDGEETHTYYSKFLFDMVHVISTSERFNEWVPAYREEVIWNFNRINNLIASIKDPA